MGLTLKATYQTHEVQDEELRFYPLSLNVLFQLREIAEPLVKSLAVLFARNGSDIAQKILHKEDMDVTEITAIEPELAKERHEQVQSALTGLVAALFEKRTGNHMALIIMDSLREDYKDCKGTEKECRAFLETPNLTIDVATEILVGVAKANKGVLDPLGIPRLLELIASRFGLSSLTPSDASGSEPENESLTLVPKETSPE